MPLYEYECKQCGHRFERIVQYSDPPEKVCPKCGGEVEQMLSAPAVQFKGAGWYVTDYAKKSGGPAKSSSGESSSSSDSSSKETKSEKKTESAPAGDAKPAAPASSSSEKKS
jgi:putative FmdB family regulatory protein